MANILDLQSLRAMAAQMANAGGNCISVLSVAQLKAEASDPKAVEGIAAEARQSAAPPGNCISVLSVATMA